MLRRAGIYLLCAAVVVLVRVGLWTIRYQTLRRWLVRCCPPDPQPHRIATVARITRSVARVARLVPDASCLTQTIAAQALLSWKGLPSTIAIGLRKGPRDTLEAHAWLVWNGGIVLQGDDTTPQDYARVLDLDTPTAPVLPS